jgi:dienelactone hydrolase
MGAMDRVPCRDGGSARGYLAAAGGSRTGIVMIQEWRGLNDPIRGVADRL